jgi:phytoene synthase
MAEFVTANSGVPTHEALLRSAPPGSPRQLALLFTTTGYRATIAALYALEAEFRHIADSRSLEAAHARLEWWREELNLLAVGRPTHPLAKGLLSLHGFGFADWPLLHEPLIAAEVDLARVTYRDWPELESYCFRAAGALQTVIAMVLAGGRPLEDRERRYARLLGEGLRQAEMLRDLRLDASLGRSYAPLQIRGKAGVDPMSVAGDDADAAERTFALNLRERVRARLASLEPILETPELRRTHRHGLVLAALNLRMIERLESESVPAAARFDLEPLARLWTAWRTAVRIA